MAYIRRIDDGRVFELFGTDRNFPGVTLFLIYEPEGDQGWLWRSCIEYEPLEVLEQEDFELDDEEEEEDDEKEDKL